MQVTTTFRYMDASPPVRQTALEWSSSGGGESFVATRSCAGFIFADMVREENVAPRTLQVDDAVMPPSLQTKSLSFGEVEAGLISCAHRTMDADCGGRRSETKVSARTAENS